LFTTVAQARLGEILNRGLLAIVRLRQGRMQAAQEAAETVARLIGSTWPTSYGVFGGYLGLAQVHLALWEEALSGGAQAKARALRAAARKACKTLHTYARHFPVGGPRAWLYRGQFEWLSGHPRRAHRQWRRSLALARQLAMPYEEALAHHDIGRHLHAGHPARREHLAQAVDILARVGAAYDLERVKVELSDSHNHLVTS
jgi:hypothetical protein